MIKFEYKPWEPERTWGYAEDIPPVEQLTMTLGDGVTWQEATDEFHNFLRGAGYVIPYYNVDEADEDDYIDCSDPLDMDKSGPLGDRQPEWAMRMSGPAKWWYQSNTEVASEDESNTDVAEKPAWISMNITERAVIIEQWHMDEGKPSQLCRMVEAKLKELNT